MKTIEKLFEGQEILDLIPHCSIIGIAVDGTISLWNEGAAKMYGYSPGEVIGKMKASMLYPSESVEKELLKEVLKTGKWEGPVPMKRKTGEVFTARVLITKRNDGKGFLHISNEIEQKLEELQMYLQDLRSYSVDGLLGISQTGNIYEMNKTACEMLGEKREQLLGKLFKEYVSKPDDFQKLLDETFEKGTSKDTTLTLRSNALPVSVKASLAVKSTGGVRGIYVSLRDLSERIALENQLESQYKYLRGMINTSADGIFTLDLDGKVTDVNEQCCKILGYIKEELIGIDITDLAFDPVHAKSRLRHIITEGYVKNLIAFFKNKEGKLISGSVYSSLFYDPQGQPMGIFGSVRDITHQINLENQLKEKNLELTQAILTKDKFLTAMSHEFRTPLTAILGYIDLMLLDTSLNEKFKTRLGAMKKGGNHLLELVNDLLDMAKIQSGKVVLGHAKIDCRQILTDVSEELKSLALEKGLQVNLSVPKEPLYIHTDPRSLKQILINLLNNAIKFTKQGHIDLSVETSNGTLWIHVQDTGIGIKPEDRGKLFTIYGQMDTSQQEGTGLGLYISHQLAHLLGGEITCESEFGKGSRFTLRLRKVVERRGEARPDR